MMRALSLFLLFFVIILLFLSTTMMLDNNVNKDQIIVVATTSIIADAVKNIARDTITLHCLMGPGIDPHLYRARESDVHKIAAADVIFYNGLHLEGKMGKVFEGMAQYTHVIAVTDALDKTQLREAGFAGMYDPHVWFDVCSWIKIVRYITTVLARVDAIHATEYEENSNKYIAQLELLHEYIHKKVSSVPPDKRILITAHDAFGYFGDQYGFEVIGLQGLSTDADISAHDIQCLSCLIIEKKVPVIFVESSIPWRSIVAVKNNVQSAGWSVDVGQELYSDALSDHTLDAATYCDMIRYNVDTIVNALC